MGIGNDMLLPHVLDTAYEPRLLSDHTPFWVRVDTAAPSIRPMWRVNPFWLTLFPTPDPIPGELREFLIFNKHYANGAVVWDAIKAFLRGLLIREISGIKKRSREWEDTVRLELQNREMVLMMDPTPAKQNSWKEAQSLYNKVVLSTAEINIFFAEELF